MNAIDVQNLTRRFDRRLAVDGITFAVEEGEVFGFLGPNGAGKTTTLRMLTGQLLPTSGSARVAGCDVVHEVDRLKPQIGVVFEHQNLYPRLSGRENLAFAARLYGVDGRRVEELLDEVRLRERAGDRIQKYSNGMKQRLLIARALLHAPRVLFLDEPTRGLDPSMSREIRELVAELGSRGVTVFLTTHYMEEADQLCRRVAFMNQGRLVALDTPERLKVMHGRRCLQAVLRDGREIALRLDDPDDGRRLGELAAGGLAVPAGFDAAVEAGQQPELTVYLNRARGGGGVAAFQRLVEQQVWSLVDQPVPARIAWAEAGSVAGLEARDGIPLDAYLLVMFVVMGLAMTGAFMVPTLLVEEREKHTLDALLVSPARASEVVAGKALTGMVYSLLVAGVLLALNRGWTGDWSVTLLAVLVGTLLMVAVGLFMGRLFQTTNQVNTWASIVMLALMMPSWSGMIGNPPALERSSGWCRPTI